MLQSHPEVERKHLACLAGATVAGAALGLISGRPSLGIGAALAGLGIWQKNIYLVAGGGAMAIAVIPQFAEDESKTVKGLNGFDLKTIAEGMKDRAGLLLDNLSYKLYLPKKASSTTTTTTDKGTNGLNGGEKEQVSYFVNPYNQANRQPDYSELDKVTAEIEASNGNKTTESADEENIENKNY